MRRRNACQVLLALLLTSTSLLAVSIQPVKAWNGTVYIHADGSIDPQTAPIQKNGDLYTLTGNIISDGDGIVIEKGSITLDGNSYTVQGNYGGNGLSLTSISDVAIRNTNVQSFYYGVFLTSASQNTISGNNITTNNIGVVLISSSDYNNITGNNVEQDSAYGIYFDSSSNNNIYHNNFANNIQQAYTSYSTNTWDHGYPVGGNYWSDYSEPDLYSGPFQNETGSDGIGDTPYVLNQNDVDNYPLITPLVHDVGITSVSASKTVVEKGYTMNISVQIINYGAQTETFNVVTRANSTVIKMQTAALAAGASDTLTCIWDTSAFAKGNYSISAYAGPIQGENVTADNNSTDGWVVVATVGDITGPNGYPDGTIDGSDLIVVARCFGSYPGAPPPLKWNANCDITNDNAVDGSDLIIVARHFGQVG